MSRLQAGEFRVLRVEWPGIRTPPPFTPQPGARRPIHNDITPNPKPHTLLYTSTEAIIDLLSALRPAFPTYFPRFGVYETERERERRLGASDA